jgi:Microtubule-binding stalk of dynein motor
MHGLEAATAAAVAGEAAARGAVGASARAAESIAFRRRLLEADGPGGSDAPDSQQRGDYSTVSAATMAAAAAQAAAHAAHEVPHSLLIQARQERSLVDLMLRRYRRGESGHYCEDLSALGECSAPVGASYPGRYYNKVKVCVNCYRVYKLMDSRRAEAVSRLTAHSNGHSNGQSNRHNHTTTAVATAAMTAQLHTAAVTAVPLDAAYSATDSDTGVTDNTAAAAAATAAALAALSRARAAMACVTAGDIAELRTFAKPPPAVRMAAAAMMLLLTGAGDATAAGWAAARRYYCSYTCSYIQLFIHSIIMYEHICMIKAITT